MTDLPRVFVRSRRARPFFARHPWVMEGTVDRVEGEPAGGPVDLVTDQGEWIARGLLNPASRLRVRLYAWDQADGLDEASWLRRLDRAIDLRQRLGLLGGDSACRVVFSEGDGFSGLIVDKYGSYLVVQPVAKVVLDRIEPLIARLVERLSPAGVLLKVDEAAARLEGAEAVERVVHGDWPTAPVFIRQGGVQYGVDLTGGQKTGFYLDQHDNRLAAARLSAGASVLDLCCYTGGFGLTCLASGGAKSVLGIDSSETALTLARENARLNSLPGARFEKGDAFESLRQLGEKRQTFDMVVLDPPKFAGRRDKVEEAFRAYHRLNLTAVKLLSPGGILVTCSCSGHVTPDDFAAMLSGVAATAGRDLQILERRGASSDHPVSASCLESQYLKCFLVRVV